VNALIVGGAPDPGVADVVARIAAAHDLIIAADAGASACLAARRTPDLVVGDFDSLQETVVSTLTSLGVQLHRVSAEKDVTDLDLAVAAARERGADSLTFSGVFGGRLDHSLASIGTVWGAADLEPLVVEPGLEGWLLAKSGRRRLTIDGRRGATLSLIALEDPVVTCSGLRYPLEQAHLGVLSSRGVSNVVEEDAAYVQLTSGVLLVLLIHEHDG